MGRDGESKILFPTMKSLDSDKKGNKESESTVKENCDQIATVEEKIDFSNVKIEPLFEDKGGVTDISNCQMLCKTHNRAKGNK